MKIEVLIIFSLFVIASAEVFLGDGWQQVKSPLDSPRYQKIMDEIFPGNTFLGRIARLQRGSRIAGGDLARKGQFIHQALLLTVDSQGDTYVCGGSIISHNWILTAAHCLDNIVKVSVYVGIIDRINGPAVWGIEITNKAYMIMHENYDKSNISNDIALIRLVNTIVNDPNVGYINIPKRSEVNENLETKLATIAGFGRYSDTTGPSQYLRYVSQPILANSACEKIYGKANVKESNLCLDGAQGKSSCQGDSGGGLTVSLNGRTVVVGIVSFGAQAGCTLNYPTVYTRVTSFLDWIQTKSGIVIS